MVDHAIVDQRDADRIASHKWHLANTGYAVRYEGASRTIYMHREILGASSEEDAVVDHLNGDKLDNRRLNLRLTSNKENVQHRTKLNKNNSSGHRGVTYCKQTGKWAAKAKRDGESIWLGRHASKEDAAKVVKEWRRENMPGSKEALAQRIPH